MLNLSHLWEIRSLFVHFLPSRSISCWPVWGRCLWCRLLLAGARSESPEGCILCWTRLLPAAQMHVTVSVHPSGKIWLSNFQRQFRIEVVCQSGARRARTCVFPLWLLELPRCPDKLSSSRLAGLFVWLPVYGGCVDPDGSSARSKPARWHTFDANKLNELHFLWPSTPLISDPLLSRTLGGSSVTCCFPRQARQTLTSIKKKKKNCHPLLCLAVRPVKYDHKMFCSWKSGGESHQWLVETYWTSIITVTHEFKT